MKKTGIIIIMVFISNILSGQPLKYSISCGNNCSFFTKIKEKTVDYSSTSFYAIYSIPAIYEIKSKAGFGFFITGDVTFPINTYFSLTPGLAIKFYSADLHRTLSFPQVINSMNPEYNPVFFDEYSVFSTAPIIKRNNKFYALSLPIQLQLGLLDQKLLISGGLSVSKILHHNIKLIYKYGDPRIIENSDDFKDIFFSTLFNIKYQLSPKIYAVLANELSLSKIEQDSEFTYSNNRIHLNQFSLSLSYNFNSLNN